MKLGRSLASLLLISLVLLTTFCAQACFDPVPASKCPMHQTNDCCKHEDSNAGRVTLATLNHHRITKVFSVRPAQLAPLTAPDPFVFSLLPDTETGFQSSPQGRLLSPSCSPHILRI
jgi:hypothetical protein